MPELAETYGIVNQYCFLAESLEVLEILISWANLFNMRHITYINRLHSNE